MHDFQRKKVVDTDIDGNSSSSSSSRVLAATETVSSQFPSPSSNISRSGFVSQTEESNIPKAEYTVNIPVTHDDSFVFILPHRSAKSTAVLSKRDGHSPTSHQIKCSICGHIRSRSHPGAAFSSQDLSSLHTTSIRSNLAALSAGRSDPFNVLPIDAKNIQYEHVDHCKHFFRLWRSLI